MSVPSAPSEIRKTSPRPEPHRLNESVPAAPQAAWPTRFLRNLVVAALRKIRRGSLELVEGCRAERFGTAAAGELSATIRVRDPRFYGSVAFGGSLGAAEAYLDGYWDADDLTNLLRLISRNLEAAGSLNRGLALVGAPARRAIQFVRRNTRSGSRRNIAAHYDLGNEFFQQFLDDTMAYSCGIFERPDSTLREASVAKFERICRALRLAPSDHLLEIGTGWGGFALHAAKNYGCRVTTTTISREQFDYARELVRSEGLEGRIELLEDYRDLRGVYDKLASIEMIEAVGHEYLPAYFSRCSELLAADGIMALQAITIPDQRYDAYRKSTDFIQKHIFPGGCLPSLGAICAAVRDGTDLRISHLQDLAPHYARTLREWSVRFEDRRERIRSLGADERFLRSWQYYFSYCEAGFAERQTGVAQIVLSKPDCRIEPTLSAFA
ncbi:MAG: class I SAM-dependent methyltransferase [Thermoguttaceae bacterium]